MYKTLKEISERPEVFGVYTAASLWADEYRSKQMLEFHLNEGIDVSSRNLAFIETSSSWIIDRFDLGPGRSVCDFGCGPGLYASRLAKSGAAVTGLDFSTNSIGYAREQAKKANQPITYLNVNYLDFEPQEAFDLITMIMCDFCALSPVQRKQLLHGFRKGLNDGGAILLDVYAMPAYGAREESSILERNQLNHFWSEEEYYCFVNTFKYDADAVILDKYSIFEESGKTETVYNWLQYYTPDRLSDELSDAGFTVTSLLRDVSGRPYDGTHTEFAIVAVKSNAAEAV